MGDALARVENAQRVIYSRDPHLAAIGFVWPPLPGLAILPLIAFKGLWPDLVRLGFASNIVSAMFMAGAVFQLRGFLVDMRATIIARLVLTAAFGLHPIIAFFGANGMAEAPLLFFLILSVRYLARWLAYYERAALVYAGFALGCAYLTRYEAGLAGVAVMLLTAAVSFGRSRGSDKGFASAVTDSLIIGAPFLLAAGVWSAASWLIIGHPFDFVSSLYGSHQQQVGDQIEIAKKVARGPSLALKGAFALEPFLPVAVALAALTAKRHHDLRVLAVLGVFGSVLAFNLWLYTHGALLPDLRYLITAVPFAVLLSGLAVAQQGSDGRAATPGGARNDPGRNVWVLGWVAAITVALAIPTAAAGVQSPTVNPVESQADFFNRLYVPAREVASYLDSLHLRAGSVLVDDFLGFAVVVSSQHQDQFIITSDRDFTQVLGDPRGSGVEYVLVPSDSGFGTLDALNRAYPEIYTSGASVGTLVQQFGNRSSGQTWRLYRVTPPSL
jgi:hypothetical protein